MSGVDMSSGGQHYLVTQKARNNNKTENESKKDAANIVSK